MSSASNNMGVITMIRCPTCNRQVPENNLQLHQLTCNGPVPSREGAPVSVQTPPRTISTSSDDDGNNDEEYPLMMDVEDEIEVENVARMPDSGPIELSSDEEEQHRPSRRRRNHRQSRPQISSSAAPAVAAQVVDLSNDSPSPHQTNEWACPRCTLLNPNAAMACSACFLANPERPPDPTRRERLIDPSPVPPASPMVGGALLGSLIGGADAYMRGRPISTGVIGGAMTGAVGGAAVESAMRASSTFVDPTLHHQNSATAPSTNRNTGTYQSRRAPRQQRNSIRVIRANGHTIVTSSNRRSSSRIVRPGDEDPLMALLQSLGAQPDGDPRQMMLRAVHGQNIDRMSYDQLLQAFGNGTENMGASIEAISSLPTTTIQVVEKELPPDTRECLVCLEEFKAGDERKTLPCLHGFHSSCIDKWLRQNGSCPICKHSVSV